MTGTFESPLVKLRRAGVDCLVAGGVAVCPRSSARSCGVGF